uniref:Putative salivary lipocalin n=1 Tax=Ixodes ricinus TaxID=34613 RepID=A0A0K8RLU0_IXORI
MLSVLVLALCLLISGGISADDTEDTPSTHEEIEETTSTTSLSGPVFNYSETNPELEKYQDAWRFVPVPVCSRPSARSLSSTGPQISCKIPHCQKATPAP